MRILLRFLHGYLEESWQGLVKRSLIDDTSGVKFHQNYDTPADRRFNQLARKNGPLYEIVRECSRPFYIDRLQGGWWFLNYAYDRQLLNDYQEICGRWMLGLQMHEWASNMNNDWRRIQKAPLENQATLSVEAINQATTDYCHVPGIRRPWLESASAEEYASLKMPQCAEEAIEQYKWLFRLRQQQWMNLLLPADSHYMAIRYELEYGARALMPEIGAQIPLERWQIALTRGMAKSAGIPWGTYYEPWGGNPFGCCYYKRDFNNEWSVPSAYSGLFAGFFPNGGSSRALQKRLYYHSLLSGAHFLSEEWGNANTFYDWIDYELTPYGQIKKAFIDFLSLHRYLGDTVTPVVLVLPHAFEIFDISFLSHQDDTYIGFPLTNPNLRRQFSHIREVLQILLGDPKRRYGNEGHVIGNSAYGDLFDIVYDDVDEKSLRQYAVLVDLNLTSTLASRHPELAGRIIDSKDTRRMEQALQNQLGNLLPCQVNGQISWILNRTEYGWVLGLFNNEGVDRSQEKGDVFIHEADAIAQISAPGCRIDVLSGNQKSLRFDGENWYCDIPAGQMILLKLLLNMTRSIREESSRTSF